MPNKTELKRRQPVSWKEPNRRGKGPTMTAKAVAEKLGYKTVASVHVLARRGPEVDGLAAYIPDPETGVGWKRTHEKHGGVEMMFYAKDVEKWDREHPKMLLGNASATYTEEEKAFVLSVAEQIKEPDGSVYREKLRVRLAKERPGDKKKPGSGWGASAKYPVIKRILDDAGVPLPPRTPKSDFRRQYRAS